VTDQVTDQVRRLLQVMEGVAQAGRRCCGGLHVRLRAATKHRLRQRAPLSAQKGTGVRLVVSAEAWTQPRSRGWRAARPRAGSP